MKQIPRNHGLTMNHLRMFWMMIVARGIAGFGAGGEYPVCATSATEAADETEQLRKRRGFLVAVTTDFAVDLVCGSLPYKSMHILMRKQGFVAAGLVALIVLACYHQQNAEGVWRISFGLGFIVSVVDSSKSLDVDRRLV